jgi:hypothetical protein
MFVHVYTERVKMCPVIDNPASFKIRAVIYFLFAEIMSAV